jgi:2-polyprenyl-6-methoxyphenol hydroxylase-like FAD-dependent oxidoreductase
MNHTLSARCCIAGGGPAGMMLGLLLARAGVDVLVLEKHADFLRDFRGDTVHPSTLQVMDELGLLDEFLQRPHTQIKTVGVQIGPEFVQMADFSGLPERYGFVALMPQWDFLDFLAAHAKRHANFRLMMRTEATDLIRENDRVIGVRAVGPDGDLEIRADLVVAADGRHSVLRQKGGFKVFDLGAPMDVLWMRLSRRDTDPATSLGRVGPGALFVTLDRGDYWQCAYVIAKGGIEEIQARGLPDFRARIVQLAPYFADRVDELQSWDDVKLLTVVVNRAREWYRPGLLLIGDAAHAMSPIGGVGINLAIQDAVATANLLGAYLRQGPVGPELLRLVQRRRETPTRLTQGLQLLVQNRVVSHVLALQRTPRVPLAFRLLRDIPRLQRIPAHLIAIGFLPEHVQEREPYSPADRAV